MFHLDLSNSKRQIDRQSDRHTYRQRQRRHRERQRQRQRQTDRDGDRQTETEIAKPAHREPALAI